MAERISLSNLSPFPGSKKKEKRVGRGPGSGHGKTACKGHKGQKARAGGGVPPWFEGGQMPILRRLPKRGFKNPFKIEYAVLNVGDLAKKFSDGAEVSPEILRQAKILKGTPKPLKILGDGEIKIALKVKCHAISKSAREKIEAAGGTVEIISR
nr:50S ribosomal protein L15 [Thermodesulfatator atlanticus]